MACIRKRRGAWVVDYRDVGGIRRWVTCKTKRQADAVLAERIREASPAAWPVENREIRLGEYAESWLKTVEHEVEVKTLRSYTQQLRLHVLPTLGRLKLREIHRRHVRTLLAQKREGGLAKNSVRLIRAALSSLLSDAVDDGIIAANPALQLGRKKRKRVDTITQADRQERVRPLTWAQRDAVLEAAKFDRRHAALFATLAKAGLRPGEAFALHTGDLDFKTGTVRVERAWGLGRIKPTKTHESRLVDLTPDLVRTLQRHLGWVKEDALRRGLGEPQWLFPNEHGRPLDQSKVGKAFRRALKRAGLPTFRVYDLRHTFASLLLAVGAPITYVSAQLGHANAATTLRYYAKWVPTGDRRWVTLLDTQPRSGSRTVAAGAMDGRSTREVPELVGAGGGT